MDTRTRGEFVAAPLHAIGKLGGYDDILDKSGKLTDAEYAMVERPYRTMPGKARAMDDIRRHAGTQFDHESRRGIPAGGTAGGSHRSSRDRTRADRA